MVSKNRFAAFDAALKLAEPDLSIPLLRTLITVYLNPNLSVTELAEAIGVPQQTASRYVAILQGRYQTMDATSALSRDPLLATRPSSSDLRRYELVLTPRGVTKIETIVNKMFSPG